MYVLVLHIEHVCLLKTTTTTPYVCAHIYEERRRRCETSRRRKSASALKRARFLNCSLFVFVLFSSLSFVVVVVRISRSGGVLLLLTYSISARSRGFYRANKNSILSVKKHVLNTRTRTCVREFSSGAFSRALDV